MQGWLEREIADIMKATELRIKDAARLVGKYASGEISRDEAADLSFQYTNRWGDALPGVFRSQGMSDEAILAKMDEAQGSDFVDRLAQERSPGKNKAKE